MNDDARNSEIVGRRPALPWPLSACRWWTEPVRAERLAAVRIGIAAALLLEVAFVYWPHRHDFYGPQGLGRTDVYPHYSAAPQFHWSIFRGLGHPLTGFLLNLAWAVAVGVLVVNLWARLSARQPLSKGLWQWVALWIGTGVLSQCILWHRQLQTAADERLLIYPLINLAVATLLLIAGRVAGNQSEDVPRSFTGWLWAGWLTAAALVASGYVLYLDHFDVEWLHAMMRPGTDFPRAIDVGTIAWIVSCVTLLLGLGTRFSAFAVWFLSISFGNINPSIDNSGDIVRTIILFYMVITPCGAVWSLDRLRRKRTGQPPPVAFIHPWPLRLMFLQLTLIYFSNGLFKVSGGDWRTGESLYYVLHNLTFTRFSFEQLNIPLWVLKLQTWVVLYWELGFPLWVALRWTRKPALWLGALFHLGILITMELGAFQLYMLCLYLPLVPWERWGGGEGVSAQFV